MLGAAGCIGSGCGLAQLACRPLCMKSGSMGGSFTFHSAQLLKATRPRGLILPCEQAKGVPSWAGVLGCTFQA